MPTHRTQNDFDHFDEWDILDQDDDLYAGESQEMSDEWEDDGAIAQVREPEPIVSRIENDNETDDENSIQLDETTGQVFSLLEKTQAKRNKELLELAGPSEDELNEIEQVGIDDYIDIVLAEEDGSIESRSDESPSLSVSPSAANVRFDDSSLPEEARDIPADSHEVSLLAAKSEETTGSSRPEGRETVREGTPISLDVMDSSESELVVRPMFEGAAFALPTLFDEDGEVEYKTTARLAKRIAEENGSAIFVSTADGEGSTLSLDERVRLLQEVRKSSNAFIVADISAASTRQSLEIARQISDYSDAFQVTLNSSIKDPYALCEAIYESHRAHPIVVRLEGAAESLPISPEFLYDLPISGVIDATGNLSFHLHLMGVYAGPVYLGTVEMLAVGRQLGAAGAVLPHLAIHADLVIAAFEGDPAALIELAAWERETGSSATRAIKIALESQNLVSSTMRD